MKEAENDNTISEVVKLKPGKIRRETFSNNDPVVSKYFPLSCISVLENTNDLIVSVNSKFTVEYVNKYISELTGYEILEVIGRSIFDFLTNEEGDRLKAIVRKIADEKRNFSLLRGSIISKTGKKVIVEINGVPVFNRTGKLAGYFCIIRNISERENAEEQLESLVKELKENILVKDKFFSIVAHDIKSPFHGLLGLSGILANEFENMNTVELKRHLLNINTTAKNVYNLVEDLLEWARIQTNRVELQPEKLDLNKEVKSAISLLNDNASAKNITVFVTIPPDTWVLADQKMLQSVLLGLVTNALKFTNPGGFVIIKSKRNQSFEQISVLDNGLGIAPENIGKLFKPDTHYTTIGTLKEVGTGLGLLLCKEQVELNGGKIWVESKVGYGSQFFFTLQKI